MCTYTRNSSHSLCFNFKLILNALNECVPTIVYVCLASNLCKHFYVNVTYIISRRTHHKFILIPRYKWNRNWILKTKQNISTALAEIKELNTGLQNTDCWIWDFGENGQIMNSPVGVQHHKVLTFNRKNKIK